MRKKLQAVLAFAVAFVAALAVAAPAWAEDTGSITITPPAGTQSNVTNSYVIKKVFDVVTGASAGGEQGGITYHLISGKTTVPDVAAQIGTSYNKTTDPHFILHGDHVHYGIEAPESTADNPIITDIDASKGLTDAAVKAVAVYVENDEPAATANSTGTQTATYTGLGNGYYYVSTTNGSLALITTAHPNATIEDKNTVPSVDKIINDLPNSPGSISDDNKSAITQLGGRVQYKSVVTFGKGSVNVKYHDKMDSRLRYNNDASVTFSDTMKGYSATVQTTPDQGDTFTIDFSDGIAEDATATITYTATVLDEGFNTDGTLKSLDNTAYVSYGTSGRTPESNTSVYTGRISAIKHDGVGSPLAGAVFVLKSPNDTYYKYNEGSNNSGPTISWESNVDQATHFTSNSDGNVVSIDGNTTINGFYGIPNGTYTLVETDVPDGYNRVDVNGTTVTINSAQTVNAFTVDNLSKSVTIINRMGASLPGTGGAGTVAFYVIGAGLMIGAVVYVVSKKRAASK